MTKAEFMLLNTNILINTCVIINMATMLAETDEDRKKWGEISKQVTLFHNELSEYSNIPTLNQFTAFTGGDGTCRL